MLENAWGLVAHDIGIDLGTANTLVGTKDRGILINEPTVVAMNERSREVLAVGAEAKRMLGRTPPSVVAVRPLRHGVITDFDTTESMLRYFITKVHRLSPRPFVIPRPRVVIGVPSTVTEVERQAVTDAAKMAGSREVYLVEEAMAAAIGCKLKIKEPKGSMIVDIGGGTSDIAVLSLGGIVTDKTITVAGDEMDRSIVEYMKNKYSLMIGERSAEQLKIEIGSASVLKKEKKAVVKGRDLLSGLPKGIEVGSVEVREALSGVLARITQAIKEALEDTPPELVTDIYVDGITITGGGGLLRGIDSFWEKKLGVPAKVADSPMSSVARGALLTLKDMDLLRATANAWEEVI